MTTTVPKTPPRQTGRWLLRRTADAVMWTLIALGCGMPGLGGSFMVPPPWGRESDLVSGPRRDGDRR